MAQKPNLPEQTWSITKEEKEVIVDLGRELTKFIFDYAHKKGMEKFHAKYAAGAFQYFVELQQRKAKLIGDDILITSSVINQHGLGDQIEEPFVEQDINVPTKEEQIAALKAQLEELEKPEVKPDADVTDAMNAPAQGPVPMADEPAKEAKE